MRSHCFWFLARSLLLLAGVTMQAAGADDSSNPVDFLPASDARFHFEGRVDLANPAAPVIIWEGTRITVDFEGPHLVLCWGTGTGQNFFNATVDGQTEIVGVPAGATARTPWPRSLAAGRHRLILFKRSEATAGQVAFNGIEIGAGQKAWAPEAPAYKLRMEFQGDSITAGACNEDGDKDQWDDRRTHNFALCYATLVTADFGADLRCEAVSGIGIVTGWTDINSGQMWDRIYPAKDSPRADLTWQPDVLFVNLGDNDDDFPRSHHLPFPKTFTVEYVKLIHAMRAANPHAHIVLLMGGMFGGAQSVPLREAWMEALRQLESSDAAISHFIFTHWYSNHPRVAEHRILAAELTTWNHEVK